MHSTLSKCTHFLCEQILLLSLILFCSNSSSDHCKNTDQNLGCSHVGLLFLNLSVQKIKVVSTCDIDVDLAHWR